MADELFDLMKKNLREGLIALAQGPDAFHQQAEAMFRAEGPPEFVRSATRQQMRDAFRRAIHELFPAASVHEDEEECTPEIEANYQKLLAAAEHGADALRLMVEAIRPDTNDWVSHAWGVIAARQKGRPLFLWDNQETGGLIHWSPEEGVLRKVLNAQI